MNKIPAYIAIAILLGTVTMVIPYTLLRDRDYPSSLIGESTLTEPTPEQPSEAVESPTLETTEPPPGTESIDSQELDPYTMGERDSNGDILVPDKPESEAEPSPEAAGAESEAPPNPQSTFGETDLIAASISSLSSIGLMIVPSFLIALGAFIYLKRWRG
jgi:hypothetical protein